MDVAEKQRVNGADDLLHDPTSAGELHIKEQPDSTEHITESQSITAILRERKRRGSDSDQIPEEDPDEDVEEVDEDTHSMLRIPEEEATSLIQCPPIDQCFDSWEDFHHAMDHYCIATHQPMRLRTSDSAKAVNLRAARRNSLKNPIDESIGFVKKLYLCTHGVKTKPRGKGKRPRQHYRYMGCPAMIRACISERKPGEGHGKDKYVVRVVAQINKHNHRLSEHLFKSYSESRVVIDDDLIVPLGPGKIRDESTSMNTANAIAAGVDSAAVSSSLDEQALKAAHIFQSSSLDMLSGNRIKMRAGWIGTGIMGQSMCRHLLHHGYDVTVCNRTPSKCNALQEKGARVVSNAAEVANYADIIFIMVGYPSEVHSVILDPHTGILSRMRVGGIIVDMTTNEPTFAKELYEMAKVKGVSALDAPVSGGDIGARDGALSIMVGGDVDAVYAAMPYFNLMGKNIRHMGGPGAGQHTKMVNQILIASTMVGVVEGLLYAHRCGLELNEIINVVSMGAARSWSISHLGPRIAERDFEPGFFIDHFIKDMAIALQEAQKMRLSLPGLALAHQFYIAAKAHGHGRSGIQALMIALEQLNGVQNRKSGDDVEVVFAASHLAVRRSYIPLPNLIDQNYILTQPFLHLFKMMDVSDAELAQRLVYPSSEARYHDAGSDDGRSSDIIDPARSSSHNADVKCEEEMKQASRFSQNYANRTYMASKPYPQPHGMSECSKMKLTSSWGNDSALESSTPVSKIDIIFSGLYTLATVFTVLQGFGMLMHYTPASVTLGLYTMMFGSIVILYDLKAVFYSIDLEVYVPFLGNYFGRAITMLFFAVLCGQFHEYAGWSKFVVLCDLVVAIVQGIVFFTMKTMNPLESSANHELSGL
uniref:3hydroxyisobutyrate dehydrogenase putative n=1 Tax=Albugo laibachii Nc14 TaxID=890382 RepID=F0WKJ9_9STRA|nr:3hydroxyisobutyrate dehydrogenase putative [Albugo laibachii Nc14]|eukprot:CCA21805.1 3hydroxyisobutyrate dehydrogenase putative [Albugo laibachii Nc14]